MAAVMATGSFRASKGNNTAKSEILAGSLLLKVSVVSALVEELCHNTHRSPAMAKARGVTSERRGQRGPTPRRRRGRHAPLDLGAGEAIEVP